MYHNYTNNSYINLCKYLSKLPVMKLKKKWHFVSSSSAIWTLIWSYWSHTISFSVFRAVSEQFQCGSAKIEIESLNLKAWVSFNSSQIYSYRAISEWFQSNARAVAVQFEFRMVLFRFYSYRAVSEQFSSHLSAISE